MFINLIDLYINKMIRKLNTEIAEFIGMHCGDGTLYKTGWGSVWELRGSLSEKEYYIKSVVPLLNLIFNIKFFPKFRSGGKNGCFGIQTSKKEVTNFLFGFGFNLGKKTHNLKIPNYIRNSQKNMQRAFIKGLFDTDGCLYLEKIKKYKYYPRIEFGFASKYLVDDLRVLLKNIGLHSTTWISKSYRNLKLCTTYKIRVCGNKNVKKFFEEVKPNNPKHLNKYKFYNKYSAAIA